MKSPEITKPEMTPSVPKSGPLTEFLYTDE